MKHGVSQFKSPTDSRHHPAQAAFTTFGQLHVIVRALAPAGMAQHCMPHLVDGGLLGLGLPASVTDFRAHLPIPSDPSAAHDYLAEVVTAFRLAAGHQLGSQAADRPEPESPLTPVASPSPCDHGYRGIRPPSLPPTRRNPGRLPKQGRFRGFQE